MLLARQQLTHRSSPRSNPPKDIREGEKKKSLWALLLTENLLTFLSHDVRRGILSTLRWVGEDQGAELERQEPEHWAAKGQDCPQGGQCDQHEVTDP